ncbi:MULTISPECIES: hypothetical protein [unclassified Variovorax]|uniref:hypothetical protein n=1 Tax=unclassified Variovorax TaxID=663243 RepID=UPI00076D767C|nr:MULTISPECIES: hypothetical protein [unclassified Variovorax]KWT94698.1 hypothetical protein APY03_2573 [Variovorax sp. WDL1]PNG53162.1 hypothetical protein CHC06_04507 [Variovorax sp. B2]PNG53734.1 hypothetical protein CHC07_03554 [Variovorax sp. B4]VTV11185.1 hypothetical protein WDL1CHR_02068 [Variovorax sp. WDL1]
MRNAGCWLTWNQKPRQFEGTLLSSRASNKGDEQGVTYIYLADHGPRLYDAKVKSVFANELRIVGVEKHESAWVLQEWNCEILAD